ncbi:MAG: hypothetical protein ABL927_12605, partial [Bdellovibrionales bacterium]
MEQLLNSKRSSLLASLVTQIMTLKLSLLITGGLVIIEAILLIALGYKSPIVVGLDSDRPTILTTLNDDELSAPQIKAFVFDLLAKKFPPKPTAQILLPVCKYFSDGLSEACENEIKSKKSFIPQDVLINELTWNDKTNIVQLLIKRFANFNGSVSAIE